MQHMSDNDFDKIFKDKFEDAAVEPSLELWAKISTQLEPIKSKPKYTLPIMWMAAASVIVVVGLFTVWMSNDEETQLYAKQVQQAPSDRVQEIAANSSLMSENSENLIAIVDGITEKPNVANVREAKDQLLKKNQTVELQPTAQNQYIAIKEVVLASPTLATATAVVEELETETMYAQVNTPSKVEEDVQFRDDNSTNKKGIRNMGDLINFVVDKVDKRDKKLIKFETDEDENSSITGLNIGFVKLNKRDR